MIDINAAQGKVLAYVYTLAGNKELMVELHDETESEWVFRWNSKQYYETGDYLYRLIGTRPIAVNKITGELCEPSKQYTWRPEK